LTGLVERDLSIGSIWQDRVGRVLPVLGEQVPNIDVEDIHASVVDVQETSMGKLTLDCSMQLAEVVAVIR
jgi:hypothetical protein